ncbi:MAG: phosphoribosylformimino-5-aminoimidazole carboxamide ribotide isomerase [Eubacteriales bacterium]|nr:phosphoribosylformimino-5-aminoimidazole carboxamide ribotide isomerase [Eubacteriales bacterium]
MQFRPCIDIHNGKVKQIVGGSLLDQGDYAQDNFVSEQDAAFFAELYRRDGLKGGHIILLNPKSSEYYGQTKAQAELALHTWPGGLQIGGGVTAENAAEWLEHGASHVIATSYVFSDGRFQEQHLQQLEAEVGKEHLVLDLSCRRRGEDYWIVTDRWQKFTEVRLTHEIMTQLSSHCDEFLIHAVDVEGRANGIEKELVEMLGNWSGAAVTYAGGVGSFEDLEELYRLGKGKLNVTIGSALDLFGGPMQYRKVLQTIKEKR